MSPRNKDIIHLAVLCSVRVAPTSTESKVWPIDVYRQMVTDEVMNLL